MTSDAPDAPSSDRDLSDVSKQAPKHPKSKQAQVFDPSATPLLHQVQERTQQSTPTVLESTGTNVKYRQAWCGALVTAWYIRQGLNDAAHVRRREASDVVR